MFKHMRFKNCTQTFVKIHHFSNFYVSSVGLKSNRAINQSEVKGISETKAGTISFLSLITFHWQSCFQIIIFIGKKNQQQQCPRNMCVTCLNSVRH